LNQQLFPLPDLHGKQCSKEGEEKDGGRRFTHKRSRPKHRTDTQNQKKRGKKYNAKLQRLCEEIQKGKEREGSGLTDQGGARNLHDKQSEKQASPGWAPLLWAMH